ncbi:hypothetical protein KSP39_PZI008191 [Platanthera zijinensis]|uniref:Uncharacterized protein n=1 Tax=Platanthera zijinensis TaxID=2320716 RepID=A0AAP0BNQ4_9ASPA
MTGFSHSAISDGVGFNLRLLVAVVVHFDFCDLSSGKSAGIDAFDLMGPFFIFSHYRRSAIPGIARRQRFKVLQISDLLHTLKKAKAQKIDGTFAAFKATPTRIRRHLQRIIVFEQRVMEEQQDSLRDMVVDVAGSEFNWNIRDEPQDPNPMAKKFFDMKDAVDSPLWPGCENYSVLYQKDNFTKGRIETDTPLIHLIVQPRVRRRGTGNQAGRPRHAHQRVALASQPGPHPHRRASSRPPRRAILWPAPSQRSSPARAYFGRPAPPASPRRVGSHPPCEPAPARASHRVEALKGCSLDSQWGGFLTVLPYWPAPSQSKQRGLAVGRPRWAAYSCLEHRSLAVGRPARGAFSNFKAAEVSHLQTIFKIL